jgi:uncharacterized cupin superfamily protein
MSQATSRPVVTLSDLELDRWEQGMLYKSADISFGKLMGLKGLGISYNEVPAGKSSCPFHNHHVEEELFIILEGEGCARRPGGRQGNGAPDHQYRHKGAEISGRRQQLGDRGL